MVPVRSAPFGPRSGAQSSEFILVKKRQADQESPHGAAPSEQRPAQRKAEIWGDDSEPEVIVKGKRRRATRVRSRCARDYDVHALRACAFQNAEGAYFTNAPHQPAQSSGCCARRLA